MLSQGICDIAETCNGVTDECPTDAVANSGTSCRGIQGGCDVAESCDGVGKACPADVFAANTVVCTGNYFCSGTAAECPTSCASDAGCAGDRVCLSGVCAPGVRAFISSTTTTGAIGGLNVADGLCQNLATSAGIKGPFRAWLSDATGSPSTRFVRSSVPYYLTNHQIVANSYADITDGSFARAVYVNEMGLAVAGNVPFTGTAPNGTALFPATPSQSNCSAWTSASAADHAWCGSMVGDTPGDSAWTESSNAGASRQCNVLHRIYCFGQPTVSND